MNATYVLPLRWDEGSGIDELSSYLRSLDGVEIIVVDGSPSGIFDGLDRRIPGMRHVRPAPQLYGLNGKAQGVLTGLALASCERIIVADDDVRYDRDSLARILALLDVAEVIRPQNYFSPVPWHAVLDGARSLINRALDGDWPGTLAFRRSAMPDGYNANVLFENFELVQTIRSRGGRELVARGLFIARRPPTVRHFWNQRTRQAYDEFARPARLAIALGVMPAMAAGAITGWWQVPAAVALLSMALAATGWLRDGAFRYFSVLSVLAAPLWTLERGICAWLAVYQRVRYGGVRYGGRTIAAAASRGGESVRWPA